MPDPFVFRQRMLLIGAVFFASAMTGQFLRDVVFVLSFDLVALRVLAARRWQPCSSWRTSPCAP
ncbi:MAG: hypothetical protein LC624_07795 [Halobacteriales archaeon]|nr:hypothetical protein [Halobacteriales archaeon]